MTMSFSIIWDNILFIWNLPFVVDLLLYVLMIYVFLGALLYTNTATIVEKSFSSDYKSDVSMITVEFDKGLSETIPFKTKRDVKISFEKVIMDELPNNIIKIKQR